MSNQHYVCIEISLSFNETFSWYACFVFCYSKTSESLKSPKENPFRSTRHRCLEDKGTNCMAFSVLAAEVFFTMIVRL